MLVRNAHMKHSTDKTITALEKHPDKGGNEDEFKVISDSHAFLIDPEKRATYDSHRVDIPRAPLSPVRPQAPPAQPAPPALPARPFLVTRRWPYEEWIVTKENPYYLAKRKFVKFYKQVADDQEAAGLHTAIKMTGSGDDLQVIPRAFLQGASKWPGAPEAENDVHQDKTVYVWVTRREKNGFLNCKAMDMDKLDLAAEEGWQLALPPDNTWLDPITGEDTRVAPVNDTSGPTEKFVGRQIEQFKSWGIDYSVEDPEPAEPQWTAPELGGIPDDKMLPEAPPLDPGEPIPMRFITDSGEVEELPPIPTTEEEWRAAGIEYQTFKRNNGSGTYKSS